MRFTFDPALAKYVDNREEIIIDASTLGEAVSTLLNMMPQLHVQLMDNDAKLGRECYFILNDETVLYETKDIEHRLNSDDVINLSKDLPAGSDSVIKIIVGVVLIIIGIVFIATPAGPWLIAAGIGQIVGAIVSEILEHLLAPDFPSFERNSLTTSATYTFDGIRNTTASGTPVPIIYGTHRAGGHVLNMFTSQGPAAVNMYGASMQYTYLHAQVGMCEGPIEGVSDVFINGNPLYFYNAVETYPSYDMMRTGEVNQSPLPGFNATTNTTTIGKRITSIGYSLARMTQTFTNYFPVCGYYDYNYNTLRFGTYTMVAYDQPEPPAVGG